MQSSITYDSDTGSVYNPLYTTTFTLGAQGQVTGAAVNDGIPKTVSYVLDGAGQIIRRDEVRNSAPTQAAPHELFYRFAGKQKGVVGNNGTLDVAFDTSITQRSSATAPITSSNAGLFRDGTSAGSSLFADFSMSMEAYNTWRQGSAGGTYSVRSGDTLSGIATAVWGDASLWYLIAQANGISGDAALAEGQQLILPSGVTRSENNAGTLKPYNASDAMGSTSPTTPKPPKRPNCVLMLVVAVVAIAISAWLGPQMIAAFQGMFGAAFTAATATTAAAVVGGSFGAIAGGIVGGALTGAIASVVSQGVGVAIGAQDSINWKGVGLAALGGGIAGGLQGSGLFGKMVEQTDKVTNVTSRVFEKGALGIGSKALDTIVRGTLTSAATQVIGKVSGLQEKISWGGIAASAVGATIGHFGEKFGVDGITTSMASLVARSATRSLVDGTDFGDNVMAELPDVIAETIVGAVALAIRGREIDPRVKATERAIKDSGRFASLKKPARLFLAENLVKVDELNGEDDGTALRYTLNSDEAIEVATNYAQGWSESQDGRSYVDPPRDAKSRDTGATGKGSGAGYAQASPQPTPESQPVEYDENGNIIYETTVTAPKKGTYEYYMNLSRDFTGGHLEK